MGIYGLLEKKNPLTDSQNKTSLKALSDKQVKAMRIKAKNIKKICESILSEFDIKIDFFDSYQFSCFGSKNIYIKLKSPVKLMENKVLICNKIDDSIDGRAQFTSNTEIHIIMN